MAKERDASVKVRRKSHADGKTVEKMHHDDGRDGQIEFPNSVKKMFRNLRRKIRHDRFDSFAGWILTKERNKRKRNRKEISLT